MQVHLPSTFTLYIDTGTHILISIISPNSTVCFRKAYTFSQVPGNREEANLPMGRWVIPEVYPLLGAMAVVGGMVVFSLGRHVIMNPDVRISKEGRKQAVLDNAEEGERYAEHGLRKFLRTRTPEIFPKLNRIFSDPEKST